MVTPIGRLDRLPGCDSAVGASLPKDGVAFRDSDGTTTALDKHGLEELMSCIFISHLLFEERILQGRDFWSFPPPVSPTMPFGSVPSSEALGCAELLRRGHFMYESTCVSHIGVVDGVDVGLGLFAQVAILANSCLGEYTGVVRQRRQEEDDNYSYALPVVEPDLVVCARDYGNLCRLINHSDDGWNAELLSVHHEGLLHVVCRVARAIAAGEQILIHYGARYWLPESRRCISLKSPQ
ncbi:unnamed protein product [Polarella glacialis]|uniref:SET domain-containing protein n=1 Tax=Polarella glacialis TaxID=89957 RepID=A0A813E482_POLGL|nr:unnamed protein product [Polarella glacialis]CAE8634745.1 unnamed protein product [Polarella glacialis]CAE8730253.1 unnamed protein product [Polarella glacialis]